MTDSGAGQTWSIRYQPIVGWRTWVVTPAVDRLQGEAILRGDRGRAWEGPVAQAVCSYVTDEPPVQLAAVGGPGRLGRHGGTAPHPACRCGIHALKTDAIEAAAPWEPGGPRVGGFVKLTGLVIEAMTGYRAQRAEMVAPLELMFPCSFSECDEPAAAVSDCRSHYAGYCSGHVTDPTDLQSTEVWSERVIEDLETRYAAPIVMFGD